MSLLPKGLAPLLKSPTTLLVGAGVAVLGVLLLSRRGEPGAGGPVPAWGPSAFVGPADRVMLAGDSLAAGLAKPMRALADAAGVQFRGRGVVGSRIDEWDGHYLAEDLASFSPTVVVLSLGTNDMKMFDPASQQAGRVQSLLAKIRAAGARVAWIVPPTMPFADKGVRQMITDASPELAIHAERLELLRGPDKIHMTPSGYQTFAEAVWGCLTLSQCP